MSTALPRCQCGNPECPQNIACDLQKENSELTARIAELEANERADYVVTDAMLTELRSALAEARKDSARIEKLEALPPGVLIECDEQSCSVTSGTWSALNCDKFRGRGKTLREAIDQLPATPLPETKEGQL